MAAVAEVEEELSSDEQDDDEDEEEEEVTCEEMNLTLTLTRTMNVNPGRLRRRAAAGLPRHGTYCGHLCATTPRHPPMRRAIAEARRPGRPTSDDA